MAAAQYRNTSLGALIFYDRRGAEVYLDRGKTVTCDVDTSHPPIRAWFVAGMIELTGGADPAELARLAFEEAARLELIRLEAEARVADDAQAGSVTIIPGEPRPIS